MIRLATFNLENLFTRPVAMSEEADASGREAIEDHAIASSIASKDAYSSTDKGKLLELTEKYKWHYRDPPRNALVQLPTGRRIRSSREPRGRPTAAASRHSRADSRFA